VCRLKANAGIQGSSAKQDGADWCLTPGFGEGLDGGRTKTRGRVKGRPGEGFEQSVPEFTAFAVGCERLFVPGYS